MYRWLSRPVVVGTILILDLVEAISSVACVSPITECFWPHHVLFNRSDLLDACCLLWARKFTVSADLELGPLVFGLV